MRRSIDYPQLHAIRYFDDRFHSDADGISDSNATGTTVDDRAPHDPAVRRRADDSRVVPRRGANPRAASGIAESIADG